MTIKINKKPEEKICDCELNIIDEHNMGSNSKQIILQCDICKTKWKGIIFRE